MARAASKHKNGFPPSQSGTSKAGHAFRPYSGVLALLGYILFALLPCLMAHSAVAAGTSPPLPSMSSSYNAQTCAQNPNASGCTVCVSDTSIFPNTNIGKDMISQVFTLINKIIHKIQSTFYTGIIKSTQFQQIISTAFILYIATYGIMITFNLAAYRTGDVASRLIKIAIVYAMTTANGWTFFATWIQTPVIGGINQLITDFATANTSGSGSACVSQGSFSGGSITSSGSAGPTGGLTISLDTGPMAMLFGPMTCVFAAKFVTAIEALISTGFYGWVLALMILWGLVDFSFMLFGAIVTYVKAIIGLAFLFGLAPIFIACYLFEKSRAITQGWFSMILSFALQPVMLFAFLAFYAAIIGNALNNLFVDASGKSEDLCYVAWYNMPGLMSVFWWRFKMAASSAGGEWIYGSGGSGVVGTTMPPPARILNVLYFIVLCSLGKSFSSKINELSLAITGGGGSAAIVTTGAQVGGWLRANVTGGQGPVGMAAETAKGAAGVMRSAARGTESIFGSILGRRSAASGENGALPSFSRPAIGDDANMGMDEFGEVDNDYDDS